MGTQAKVSFPQLQANVPGTWAYDTMTRRILEGVYAHLIWCNQVMI